MRDRFLHRLHHQLEVVVGALIRKFQWRPSVLHRVIGLPRPDEEFPVIILRRVIIKLVQVPHRRPRFEA